MRSRLREGILLILKSPRVSTTVIVDHDSNPPTLPCYSHPYPAVVVCLKYLGYQATRIFVSSSSILWIIEVELSCLCIGCLHVSRLSMQEDALENAVPHRVFLEAYRICHAWPVRSLSIVHHRCFLFVSACSSACLGGSYGPAMCCLRWKEPAARPTGRLLSWPEKEAGEPSRSLPPQQ